MAEDERSVAGYRGDLVGTDPAVTRGLPMLLRRTAIALAALLVVALAAPASAATMTRRVIDVPVAGSTTTVTCDSLPPLELTLLGGSLRTTLTALTDSTSRRISIDEVFQGISAVDANGTVYRLAGGIRQAQSIRTEPNIAANLTATLHYGIVAAGSGLRYRRHEVLHLVLNPNGEIAVDVEKVWYTCPSDPV